MLEWDITLLWMIKHVIYTFNGIWIILWAMDLNILVIHIITSQFGWVEVTYFCGFFNGMYMGGKINPYDCKWSLIWFPWATIVIYFSLFGIWKVQLKTRYIVVKLANSFWIPIYVFGKRWMSSHILSYWCFNCVVEFYFQDM